MDPGFVMRAQQGDEAAFAAITRTVYGHFLGVAYRILRDRPLAEDATQQALVRVSRKLPRLRDPARFEAVRPRRAPSVATPAPMTRRASSSSTSPST